MTKRLGFGVRGLAIPGMAAGALTVFGVGCIGSPVQDPREPALTEGDAAVAVAASSGTDAAACTSNAFPAGATQSSPGSLPNATCSTTGRVICTLPTGVAIPLPPTADSGPFIPPGLQMIPGLSATPVVAQAGIGAPPAPTGGAVAPGDYQLVAVTVYGQLPPDVAGLPRAGDSFGAEVHVSCDTYNIVYGVASSDGGLGTFGGNGCGRLVPFGIPLVAVAGLADAGDTWGDWMPYSTTRGTLTLIQLSPYEDYGRGLVEGSYTVVEEFASVCGDSASLATTTPTCTPATPPARAARDPRCPAAIPMASEACTPDPAPVECEYGGDSLGKCTTLAVCALQPDGTFHFVVVPPTSDTCGSNPAECPSTFAVASAQVATDAGPCAGQPRLLCDYAEGQCGCGNVSSAAGWACAPRQGTTDCPAFRPLSGDACPTEGVQCFYGIPCLPGAYEGTPLICSGGYWEEFDAQYSCAVTIP